MSEENLSKQLVIRISEELEEKIDQNRKKTGLTRASYGRMAIFEKIERDSARE